MFHLLPHTPGHPTGAPHELPGGHLLLSAVFLRGLAGGGQPDLDAAHAWAVVPAGAEQVARLWTGEDKKSA